MPSAAREMPEAERGEWDPLPGPPTTGWEQTTILAAGLDPALIAAVQAVNPALAARCAAGEWAGLAERRGSPAQVEPAGSAAGAPGRRAHPPAQPHRGRAAAGPAGRPALPGGDDQRRARHPAAHGRDRSGRGQDRQQPVGLRQASATSCRATRCPWPPMPSAATR